MNKDQKLEAIEEDLMGIEKRNLHKEAVDGWYDSLTRKIVVAILSYVFTFFFLLIIGVEINTIFWLALIPAIWYVISKYILRAIKKVYLRSYYKR